MYGKTQTHSTAQSGFLTNKKKAGPKKSDEFCFIFVKKGEEEFSSNFRINKLQGIFLNLKLIRKDTN